MTAAGIERRFRSAVPQLQDYLESSAQRLPDKVALICQRGRLTYGQLDAESNQLAQALVRRGVRRGDRVVILAENTAETVIAFWAALKASAVACPVSPLVKGPKLAAIVDDCTPAIMVASAAHVPLLAAAGRTALSPPR